MENAVLTPQKNLRPAASSFICSVLVIFFLFYIDEGYYNFNWMTQAGNWIAFFIYLLVFTLGQCLTYYLVLFKYTGRYKITLTNVIGIPLGIVLVLSFFFLAHQLQG